MTTDHAAHDPLEFVRNMWGRMGFTLPGMVTPTFDVGELEKRIGDMRAVEGWLKMNLSMLQMAIQGLDMQRAAIAAVHAMSQPMQAAASPEAGEGVAASAGTNPFLWPWSIMAAQVGGDEGGKPATAGVSASPASETPAEKPAVKRKAASSGGK